MEKNEIIVLDEEKKNQLNEKIKNITSEGYRSLLLVFLEIENNNINTILTNQRS